MFLENVGGFCVNATENPGNATIATIFALSTVKNLLIIFHYTCWQLSPGHEVYFPSCASKLLLFQFPSLSLTVFKAKAVDLKQPCSMESLLKFILELHRNKVKKCNDILSLALRAKTPVSHLLAS